MNKEIIRKLSTVSYFLIGVIIKIMSEFRIINNKNNKIFSVVRRPVVFIWERSFQVGEEGGDGGGGGCGVVGDAGEWGGGDEIIQQI